MRNILCWEKNIFTRRIFILRVAARKKHAQHHDGAFTFACQITGDKYEPSFSDNVYKVHMKLMIRAVAMSDYGSYKCISKNSLGETDGSIKLYREYTFSIYLDFFIRRIPRQAAYNNSWTTCSYSCPLVHYNCVICIRLQITEDDFVRFNPN